MPWHYSFSTNGGFFSTKQEVFLVQKGRFFRTKGVFLNTIREVFQYKTGGFLVQNEVFLVQSGVFFSTKHGVFWYSPEESMCAPGARRVSFFTRTPPVTF